MAIDIRLLQWEQTGEMVSGDYFRDRRFVGLDPVLVRDPRQAPVLVQRGRAVAWQGVYVPPAAIYPTRMLAPARIVYARNDDISWSTEWEYIMSPADGYVHAPAAFVTWPTSPSFHAAPD